MGGHRPWQTFKDPIKTGSRKGEFEAEGEAPFRKMMFELQVGKEKMIIMGMEAQI